GDERGPRDHRRQARHPRQARRHGTPDGALKEEHIRKISDLLDASLYARSLGDHAARVATRTGAAVDDVHVRGRPEAPTGTPSPPGSLEMNANAVLLEELAACDRQKARVAQERGRLIVDQAKDVLLAAGVASVTPRLRTGDLVETIR